MNTATWSQSNDPINPASDYVLISKEKHEELRKNIEDYKALIVDFEKLKFDFQECISEKTSDNSKIISLQKNIVELQDKIIQQANRIETLENALRKQGENTAALRESYNQLQKLNYRNQAKIYKMQGYKRRFETQGMVIGFLIVSIFVVLGNNN